MAEEERENADQGAHSRKDGHEPEGPSQVKQIEEHIDRPSSIHEYPEKLVGFVRSVRVKPVTVWLAEERH
jgi:hypothetical protein